MKTAIYWFRNDLRLHDHPFWGNIPQDFDVVIPIYLVSDEMQKDTRYGFPRVGSFRRKFLLETLHDLDLNLKKLGSHLQVFHGDVFTVLQSIKNATQAETIFYSKEYTYEELKQEQIAAQIFSNCIAFHTQTLIHPEDLPFSIEKLPDVFTKFRHQLEKNLKIRSTYLYPEKIPPTNYLNFNFQSKFFDNVLEVNFHPNAVVYFKGGESEAIDRMKYYFFESNKVETYKQTRNGMIGEGYSTKFSPWLSVGAISPREIYWQLKKYESEFKANESTYWVFFELLWRDYFKFVCIKYGNSIFKIGGLKNHPRYRGLNLNLLRKWINGETNDDFVNANMIELMETGFMSNRGRQNVASYWVHNLKQDWRAAAAWFESQLIDYDVCSNYGNWNYIAGIGNDPRENRVFNTQRQAEMYDQNYAFRNLWLYS